MPPALYTISYKPTRSVVALCSFEQRTLVDKAAWDQLLATLVGAKLPISIFSGNPPIELDASDLGCDLVKPLAPLELEPVLADPYSYRVSVDPPGSTDPGDGKEKVLKKADRYAIATIELIVGTPSQVAVTLASQPPAGLTTRLLFEGRDPVAMDTTSTSKRLVFDLPAAVTLREASFYGVMFFMEDMPVVARELKAVKPPKGTSPQAAGGTVPPKALPATGGTAPR